MIQIDLITGFLGSGKTTFLKKYATYLMNAGKRIGILENDFGAINVDMLLLNELRGENCELEMVSGGCDADCHRRRFKTKLISMGMVGYDRVIVEPSGIYDVDEFFDALREEPLDNWYEIGNVIAIVDATMEEHLSKEAEYLLASEAACAGLILLSHMDEASERQAAAVVEHLNRALESIHCDRRLTLGKEVLPFNLAELDDETMERILSAGYRSESYRKEELSEHAFETLYFMEENIKADDLETAVRTLFTDPSCGEVFRVKGFLKDADGAWLQMNATADEMSYTPIAVGQEVLIVIGSRLNEARIREVLGL